MAAWWWPGDGAEARGLHLCLGIPSKTDARFAHACSQANAPDMSDNRRSTMSLDWLLAPSGLCGARASATATLRRKLSTVMTRRSARATFVSGLSMRRALFAKLSTDNQSCLTASPTGITDSWAFGAVHSAGYTPLPHSAQHGIAHSERSGARSGRVSAALAAVSPSSQTECAKHRLQILQTVEDGSLCAAHTVF